MKKTKKRRSRRSAGRGLPKILIGLTALVAVLFVYALLVKREVVPSLLPTPEASPSAAEDTTYYTINKELTSAGGITITQYYIPYDSPRRPGEIREIRYIIIHETDNRSTDADAAQHALYLASTEDDITGWHYTVDDHSIYHSIPDNEIAWNAGDQRTSNGGNMNGIAIEMCVNYGSDFEATLENTAALTAALLRNYDLPLSAVQLHADFMDKECPHRLISEGRVEEFLQMVADDYEQLGIAEQSTAD
jgi:hypothetical protein